MANRWWTDSVGLAGVDNTGNNEGGVGAKDKNEGDEKENSDEPIDEVATTRRPRGRPPGSKNRPKPPIFVTKDRPNALRSHVMEIANGADIAGSLLQFAAKRQRGVCVLSATGTVTNVTLRQPTAPGSVMALQGRFEIISLTGSFFPGPSPPGSTGLTVYLSGGQGQVVGGGVVGPLVASGPVMILVATFNSAVYERLPLSVEDADEEGQGCGGGGGDGGGSGGSPQGTRGSGGQQPGGEGSSTIPVFNVAPPNVQQLNHETYSAWAHGHARTPF